jgi:hypothetical protein
MPSKIETRFWRNVAKGRTDGMCWHWTAGRFSNGYGQFRVGKKKVRAHRYAYQITRGEIPSGMFVCHTCDQPLCVNPDHLFLGTAADNAHDRDRKGRTAKGKRHGIHTYPEKVRHVGEENGSSKLTWAQVSRLRSLRKYHKWTYAQLSELFEISKSQVANIVHERNWKSGR